MVLGIPGSERFDILDGGIVEVAVTKFVEGNVENEIEIVNALVDFVIEGASGGLRNDAPRQTFG